MSGPRTFPTQQLTGDPADTTRFVVYPLQKYGVVASTRGPAEARKLTLSQLYAGIAFAWVESNLFNFCAFGFYLALKKLCFERVYGKQGEWVADGSNHIQFPLAAFRFAPYQPNHQLYRR